MFDLQSIIRKNILNLTPYSSARDEYQGKSGIFLDANENSLGSPVEGNHNRYPDPYQLQLKKKLSGVKGLLPENILLGNGSDEAIDLLYRCFCEPQKDNVIICPPTYGMYEVLANINNVEVRNINLTPETFQLNTSAILNAIDEHTRLFFVCCPNNPTGNGVKWNDIKLILEKINGIVVVDEAYINFASYKSLIPELLNYPNLVILQTLSKAWGLAALRVGMAFASADIIHVMNKVKAPYNINEMSQQIAMKALDELPQVNEWIKEIVSERKLLAEELKKFSFVLKVFSSEANFLLIKTTSPKEIYDHLSKNGIVIR
ncbi:MAG: histidinol-phosphate transaminase, partial [Bacteroidia bacterium]|nr:histidinol-phosphate transaminase [Bacteroidia bacterium]